jgi:hypothetical protein
MNTSGRGNDALIMFVPLGVVLLVGLTLYDGPMEALSEINTLVGEVLSAVAAYVSSLV